MTDEIMIGVGVRIDQNIAPNVIIRHQEIMAIIVHPLWGGSAYGGAKGHSDTVAPNVAPFDMPGNSEYSVLPSPVSSTPLRPTLATLEAIRQIAAMRASEDAGYTPMSLFSGGGPVFPPPPLQRPPIAADSCNAMPIRPRVALVTDTRQDNMDRQARGEVSGMTSSIDTVPLQTGSVDMVNTIASGPGVRPGGVVIPAQISVIPPMASTSHSRQDRPTSIVAGSVYNVNAGACSFGGVYGSRRPGEMGHTAVSIFRNVTVHQIKQRLGGTFQWIPTYSPMDFGYLQERGHKLEAVDVNVMFYIEPYPQDNSITYSDNLAGGEAKIVVRHVDNWRNRSVEVPTPQVGVGSALPDWTRETTVERGSGLLHLIRITGGYTTNGHFGLLGHHVTGMAIFSPLLNGVDD